VTKQLQTLALVFAFAIASTAVVRTQEKAAPSPAAGGVTPLKVQVVISRYQGDKKLSSMPYSLSVTGGGGGVDRAMAGAAFVGRANLRMGAKVPIAMMAQPSVDGKPVTGIPTAGPIQYQDVGTNIDCMVWSAEDGRFRVEITIDDSSIYPDEKDTPGVVRGSPSFRSFRASDSMILKDGGTAQFTTATDKVSGEIVKVDVTITVVK
jgi:hypothetical protein